jgi:hypothetical protein
MPSPIFPTTASARTANFAILADGTIANAGPNIISAELFVKTRQDPLLLTMWQTPTEFAIRIYSPIQTFSGFMSSADRFRLPPEGLCVKPPAVDNSGRYQQCYFMSLGQARHPNLARPAEARQDEGD